MPYGLTWREIEELITNTVLWTPTCRDIVRRSGLMPLSGPGVGVPVSAMSASWIVEPRADYYATYTLNDRFGIFYDPEGGFPETFPFFPTAAYTSLTDLSGYVSMRNVIYVDTPHPELNVRVEASLDGDTWGLPTVEDSDNWLYAGCNANLGNWPASLGDESGGAIASAWQTIDDSYREPNVLLRWTFFTSPVSDGSVYDPAANEWGALRFGYADVQVG